MGTLYVAGSMRSGTTWAAQRLAREADLVCLGESSGVVADALRGGTCSCGRLISECVVWGPVLDRLLLKHGRQGLLDRYEQMRRTHRMRRFPWNALRRILPSQQKADVGEELLTDLVGGAMRESGKTGVVDTSKNVPYLALFRRLDPGTQVLHLVRDPWDVARSDKATLHKASRDPFDPPGRTPWSSACRWSAVNLFIGVYVALARTPSVLVTYEALAADPDAVTRETCRLLSLDLVGEGQRGPVDGYHLAVGNPSRLGRAAESAARPLLSHRERLQVMIGTAPARWWLACRHGVSYRGPRHVVSDRRTKGSVPSNGS